MSLAETITLEPVRTAAAWRGDVLEKTEDWLFRLTPPQVDELEKIGARFLEDDPDLRDVKASDYPLQLCRDAVAAWGADVDFGRGFVLVRGLRTHLYSDALSAAIFYVLGLHMGEPMRQNQLGDLLDHIYATSDKTMADPTALPSKVRDELVFHSDSSDVVALMCLRPGQSGGASLLVSGAEIYNEMLRRRPDLAPLLLEPFHWDWRRQDPDSPANTYVSPMVSLKDGVFSLYAGSTFIFTAQEYPETPRLTPQQIEAVELFDQITYEPGMSIATRFQPGDIQWLSNYAALHSRTAFTDFPEPQRRRHLLRLWLRRDVGRPLVSPFGKNSVVEARASARRQSGPDDQGRFHIGVASVPRL
ncbi:MAG TPA: TauD/TfdA family dioxygenase [Caulobacteraceae bacterium]|nr:TauD/TfdA family dioxygenase [Caulobacteraceae bacterium]